MSTHTPERSTVYRSRLANAKKLDPNADVTELRRAFRAARLAEHVEKALADAPPLTDEQRMRIARLLLNPADRTVAGVPDPTAAEAIGNVLRDACA